MVAKVKNKKISMEHECYTESFVGTLTCSHQSRMRLFARSLLPACMCAGLSQEGPGPWLGRPTERTTSRCSGRQRRIGGGSNSAHASHEWPFVAQPYSAAGWATCSRSRPARPTPLAPAPRPSRTHFSRRMGSRLPSSGVPGSHPGIPLIRMSGKLSVQKRSKE